MKTNLDSLCQTHQTIAFLSVCPLHKIKLTFFSSVSGDCEFGGGGFSSSDHDDMADWREPAMGTVSDGTCSASFSISTLHTTESHASSEGEGRGGADDEPVTRLHNWFLRRDEHGVICLAGDVDLQIQDELTHKHIILHVFEADGCRVLSAKGATYQLVGPVNARGMRKYMFDDLVQTWRDGFPSSWKQTFSLDDEAHLSMAQADFWNLTSLLAPRRIMSRSKRNPFTECDPSQPLNPMAKGR
jgi:hypothetical protein